MRPWLLGNAWRLSNAVRGMSTPGASGLMVIGMAVLTAVTQAQNITGFFPSTIFMSGPEVTSFLVTNSNSFNLSLAVITDTTTAPLETCSGNNTTDNWASTSIGMQTNIFKVTVTSKKNLTRCAVNETNCCTEDLCVVETLQITACENDSPISSLLIHAEIYINTTFVGLVSGNKTVIPNQVYQPLGSCPCNLTAGACDILCCCDQECNSSMKALFNGSCYSGIFGGNVSPPFDQLCSVQEKNHAPDWFPFLCVQSSMDNSPFLGYFYQGDTGNPSQTPSFNLSFQSIVQSTVSGYKQGNPILTQNGFNYFFTIPQLSTIGKCVNASPVAYLQDFNVTCVTDIAACSDILTGDLNVDVNAGNGSTLTVTEHIQHTSLDVVNTGAALPQVVECNVTVSADYTFIWNASILTEIKVSIVTAKINLTHQAQLLQRFTATFLTSNSTTNGLSGNPGYQVGKPVIVANGTTPFTKSMLNIWKPVGGSLCSTATQTPVLFGHNVFSGCFLEVINGNCTQLREKALQLLQSLTTVNYIAMRGNSNVSDPSEWVSIIYGDVPSTTCTGNCVAENVMCLKVPSNMNIEIITAVTGAVEGIPQEEILAAKVSFSTINVECVSACNLSLPLTNSVQFIQVPAQPLPSITRFQTNYTEYDCEKNEVCWQQLAYPFTKYYTGEPYHLTLAKAMILVFFFISAAVLGGPWNRIRKAWNNAL